MHQSCPGPEAEVRGLHGCRNLALVQERHRSAPGSSRDAGDLPGALGAGSGPALVPVPRAAGIGGDSRRRGRAGG